MEEPKEYIIISDSDEEEAVEEDKVIEHISPEAKKKYWSYADSSINSSTDVLLVWKGTTAILYPLTLSYFYLFFHLCPNTFSLDLSIFFTHSIFKITIKKNIKEIW